MSSFWKTLVRRIVATIREWLGTVPQPGKVELVQRAKVMALVYDAKIKRTGNETKDTVRGEMEITRTLDGVVITETVMVTDFDFTVEVGDAAAWVRGIATDDATQLAGNFVWVDDAGNESLNPATFDIVTSDTIPPSDPGAIELVLVREE